MFLFARLIFFIILWEKWCLVMDKCMLEIARHLMENTAAPAILDAYRLALDSMHSIVLLVSIDQKMVYMNQWARKLTGLGLLDYLDKDCLCRLNHQMGRRHEACALHRLEHGESFTYFTWNNDDYECEAAYICDKRGRHIGIVEVIAPAGKDIRRLDLERELLNKIRYDELTHLYNRSYFYERTRWLLDYHPDTSYALVYWNVKRFKIINDVFSNHTGNRVLVNISEKIRRLVRHEGTAGRLSDDKFVFCIPKSHLSFQWFNDNANITLISDTIAYTFKSTFGIYEIEDRTLGIDIMCDRVKLAQLSVTAFDLVNGKPYAVYDQDLRKHMLEEQELISQMALALQEGQFQTYFQPVYDIITGHIISAEALVRWQHPQKGMIPPNKFITLFERNGLISQLDRYVWNEVATVLEEQLAAGEPCVPISINVSRVDFYTTSLLDDLEQIIKAHHIPTDMMRVEVTETAYTDDPERIRQIVQQLKDRGFCVLLDDFGSGYSSFNTLKDIPVDILKLDMKFLSNIDTSQRTALIMSSIIDLASRLGMEIIAEGVETEEQASFLHQIGGKHVQGYLYARPQPLKEFKRLLQAPPHRILTPAGTPGLESI